MENGPCPVGQGAVPFSMPLAAYQEDSGDLGGRTPAGWPFSTPHVAFFATP